MFDIERLISCLAKSGRRIFHSEADFQHAFAWQIHEKMPDWKIRLEFNPYPRNKKKMFLDIYIPTEKIAIELKYFTRELDTEDDGEHFVLHKHSAQDQRRYDFLRDVQRLEELIRDERQSVRAGFALLLTNDPSYWSPARKEETVDAAFRIHNGKELKRGKLVWTGDPSQGTTKGRTEAIELRGSYSLRWQHYSQLEGKGPYGEFRYLMVPVAPPG